MKKKIIDKYSICYSFIIIAIMFLTYFFFKFISNDFFKVILAIIWFLVNISYIVYMIYRVKVWFKNKS